MTEALPSVAGETVATTVGEPAAKVLLTTWAPVARSAAAVQVTSSAVVEVQRQDDDAGVVN